MIVKGLRIIADSHGWLIAGALWLVALLSLWLQPLSAEEGQLLLAAAAHPPLEGASPLGALLLRWLVSLRPPAEIAFRLFGLASLTLGAFAGRALCLATLAPRQRAERAGALAAASLATQGGLLSLSSTIGPLALVWGVQAGLILALLHTVAVKRTSALYSIAFLALGALTVSLEVLLFPLVLLATIFLWRRDRRPEGAALIVGGLAAVAVGDAAELLLSPSITSSGAEAGAATLAVAAGVFQPVGLREFPLHQTLLVAGQSVTIALAGLIALGSRRLPRLLAGAGAALLLTAALIILTRAGGPTSAAVGALAWPPLAILAAARITAISSDLDRRLWAGVLLAPALISGLVVISMTRHESTAALARALNPEERLLCNDENLAAAIAFYRDEPPEESPTAARAVVAGDRTIRRVALERFGEPFSANGSLWLVRPFEPRYDLGLHLPEAEVSYREAGQTRQLYWLEAQNRFVAEGPEYLAVMWSYADFQGVEADVVMAQPLDDGVLEIRWDDVPLEGSLFGIAGLDDTSMSFSRVPIEIEVLVDGESLARFQRGTRHGLHLFEIELPADRSRGSIAFRLTTADDRGRHLFFDALIVEEAP